MEHIDFLKKVITSREEYWIVAKKNETYRLGTSTREPDSIMLICIPYDVPRYEDPKDILLCDMEKLSRINVINIFLNQPYPPFQYGQSMNDVYAGFPVKWDIDPREFLIKALSINSNDIYDYKDLAEGKEEIKQAS